MISIVNQFENIGFFCPKCSCGIMGKDLTHIPPYYMQCPRCGQQFIWEGKALDPNIAGCVATLNLKGWKTIKSSEGREGVTDAYIVFLYKDHWTVLQDYPLIGPWYRDCQSPDHFIIRANSITFSLFDRINTLAQWIDSLPQVYDTYYRPKPRHIYP